MKMALKIFIFALLSLLLPACNAVKCCAKSAGGKFLQLQQTSLPFILCSYGVGPVFTQCVYKGPSFLPPQPPGCPPLVNAPVCPITSVIHPKSDPTRCVTVVGLTVSVQPCNGANNQRFLFNQEVWTRIRVAGTDVCLDAPLPIPSKVTAKTCTATFNQQFLFTSAPNFILRTLFRGIQWFAPDLRVQPPSNNPLQKWTIFP